jgi:hypothetical protein
MAMDYPQQKVLAWLGVTTVIAVSLFIAFPARMSNIHNTASPADGDRVVNISPLAP